MKKIIFLLVAVGTLSFAQAQTITKISGRKMVGSLVDLNGAEISYTGNIVGQFLYLSFEFTNGENKLNAGDDVIISGKFAAISFQEDDDIIIGEDSYIGFHFIVPSGGIAANATHVFDKNFQGYDLQCIVTSTGGVTVIEEGKKYGVNVWAQCIYTSTEGDMRTQQPTPDINNTFYFVNPGNSVNEVSVSSIKMYPNPATTDLLFTNLKNTDVSIYNFVGQEMATYQNLTGNTTINVNALTNGIYFVKMKNGTSVRTEKVKIVR